MSPEFQARQYNSVRKINFGSCNKNVELIYIYIYIYVYRMIGLRSIHTAVLVMACCSFHDSLPLFSMLNCVKLPVMKTVSPLT
jgi:hypothetical protein